MKNKRVSITPNCNYGVYYTEVSPKRIDSICVAISYDLSQYKGIMDGVLKRIKSNVGAYESTIITSSKTDEGILTIGFKLYISDIDATLTKGNSSRLRDRLINAKIIIDKILGMNTDGLVSKDIANVMQDMLIGKLLYAVDIMSYDTRLMFAISRYIELSMHVNTGYIMRDSIPNLCAEVFRHHVTF